MIKRRGCLSDWDSGCSYE